MLIPDLNSLMMNDESGPLAADREFFTALSRGIVDDLDRVIADDFILIEVVAQKSRSLFVGGNTVKPAQVRAD